MEGGNTGGALECGANARDWILSCDTHRVLEMDQSKTNEAKGGQFGIDMQ